MSVFIDAPPILRRLTVADLAYVTERCEETVRRAIRSNRALRKYVSGPPYLVSPEALPLFGVSQALAAARLHDRSRQQSRPPSPVAA